MRSYFVIFLANILTLTSALATPNPKPKLLVVISVDQFGSNLFDEWRGKFTGGLHTLSTTGIVYSNAYQSHAATETCPGHSTLLTGRNPAATGIVANTWYDAVQGKDVYCAYSPNYTLAGLPKAEPRGPDNLLAPTLGDWLKAQSSDNRVYAVSGKDRAAIMMAGHKGDGVFWYVDGFGFTTYVANGENEAYKLKPLAAFNAHLRADWKKQPTTWRYSSNACAKLAHDYKVADFDFPSQIPPIGPQPDATSDFDSAGGKPFYRGTPLLDTITLDAARTLIKSKNLGHGKATDLLAIGLSSTDYMGHRYGTQGPEMCDQLTRLDANLGRFITELKALNVPMMIVLTADHGGADFVERSAERSFPTAVRYSPGNFISDLNDKLRTELKLPFYDPVKAADGGKDVQQLHIVDENGKADTGARRQAVLAKAMQLIAADPSVAQVFSREQAQAAVPPAALPADEMTILQRFAVNADATRAGDIFVAFQPFSYLGIPAKLGDTIAGHGTPYNYDRRVPIIFWWPSAEAQERPLPIKTIDIAPTLSHILGFVPPSPVDGRCLELANFGTGICYIPRSSR